MEVFITGITRMVKETEREYKYGKTVVYIADTSKTTWQREKGD